MPNECAMPNDEIDHSAIRHSLDIRASSLVIHAGLGMSVDSRETA
jgi:hypothetical protein